MATFFYNGPPVSDDELAALVEAALVKEEFLQMLSFVVNELDGIYVEQFPLRCL